MAEAGPCQLVNIIFHPLLEIQTKDYISFVSLKFDSHACPKSYLYPKEFIVDNCSIKMLQDKIPLQVLPKQQQEDVVPGLPLHQLLATFCPC